MIGVLLMAVETDEDREKILFIYNKYYRLMAYVINKIVNDISEVEDIAQDCILRIIENLDVIDLSNEDRAKGLFVTIAHHTAVDYCKKKEKHIVWLNEEIQYSNTAEESVEDFVIKKDGFNRIKKLIASMNETYRDVCLLKYIFGLKEREIALVLGLTPKVVNQRIFRGKQEIRAAIKKEKLYEQC